ncbi:MAG TPA: PspC domain-containing protein, partial [Thermoanaerobaculia bacterium]|nr:PspC domain-containing protein [Thermoanaerobaculia bacterium]
MPLYRSRKNRVIAGVCGGVAEWLGWSPTLVRVLWVILTPTTVFAGA